MMRLLIFGTGKIASEVMGGIDNILNYTELLGFIDNDDSKYGKIFYGRCIYHPGQIQKLQYDKICILLGEKFQEVYNQLVYGYRIAPEKIICREDLLKYLMVQKHKDSQDKDIKNTVKYWSEKPISFFNQYQYAEPGYDRIFWDQDENMPYTEYKGHKLYYPRTYSGFIYEDGCIYARSYRDMEQAEGSPHQYLKNEVFIKRGDVVIDAGAREGDFALAYIEEIDKLYIFESDPEWVKALQVTYREYGEKVAIIPKMLGGCVTEEMTTLQEIIGEQRIDFIKMDIEGAEVSVLESTQDIVRKNDIRCAICSYHRKGDAIALKELLERNGYQTEFSDGQVVFIADVNIFRDLDFRKAMVYAHKKSL